MVLDGLIVKIRQDTLGIRASHGQVVMRVLKLRRLLLMTLNATFSADVRRHSRLRHRPTVIVVQVNRSSDQKRPQCDSRDENIFGPIQEKLRRVTLS